MASELEFRMWLEALVRQNEQEPLGYPERLELERQLLHAFLEARAQEKRADEVLHNQINHDVEEWQKAERSLRKAAEEKAQLEQQLAQAREALETYQETNQRQLEKINSLAAELHDAPAKVASFYEAERVRFEQENAAMRALLEALNESDTGVDGECWCVFCDATNKKTSSTQDELGRVTWTMEVFHEETCIISKIRAFLAEHPKE